MRTPSGAGLIENATTCEIATNEIRTMPELHGATRIRLDAPPVYTPEEIPILNTQEVPDVKTAISSNADELKRIKSRLQKWQKILDMDTLLHIKNATDPQPFFTLARDNYDSPRHPSDASNPVPLCEDKTETLLHTVLRINPSNTLPSLCRKLPPTA
jgi:hypothetical protein